MESLLTLLPNEVYWYICDWLHPKNIYKFSITNKFVYTVLAQRLELEKLKRSVRTIENFWKRNSPKYKVKKDFTKYLLEENVLDDYLAGNKGVQTWYCSLYLDKKFTGMTLKSIKKKFIKTTVQTYFSIAPIYESQILINNTSLNRSCFDTILGLKVISHRPVWKIAVKFNGELFRDIPCFFKYYVSNTKKEYVFLFEEPIFKNALGFCSIEIFINNKRYAGETKRTQQSIQQNIQCFQISSCLPNELRDWIENSGKFGIKTLYYGLGNCW